MARRHWEEDNDDPQDLDDSPEQPREASEEELSIQTSGREELIESIKSGRNTIWNPSFTFDRRPAEQSEPKADSIHDPSSPDQDPGSLHVVVPPQSHQSPPGSPRAVVDPTGRPRSALHSGDFGRNTESTSTLQRFESEENDEHNASFEDYSSSPPPPWLASRPEPSLQRLDTNLRSVAIRPNNPAYRARAPSLGSILSSSFVMRVPTSPLVNATSHTIQEHDGSLSTNPDMTNRRRTLPPGSMQFLQMITAEDNTPNFSRPFANTQMGRESSSLSPGHRARRSLSSFTYQPAAFSHMPPFLQSRRPSVSFDLSPRLSMVGSFEESILRGRMSTAPSKPIDFVAQIGVLGKGDCKPSLRCPPHAVVPFPAVYYSYPSIPTGGSPVEENSSPYVGNIDLEHNLKPIQTTKQRKQKLLDARDPEELMADITSPENTAIGRALAQEAKAKKSRASSSKAPAGGCYRIPQQGQLQVIIKNPNKTAVKLYLVPYDLTGMEPGTKTFVRQRSSSTGPIVENPLTGSPQSPRSFDSLQDKHILRYLIHLKICCPSKDRFYLYDNVRVVFANRVPDDKEKLRNEIQLPHPKYSPYKPETGRSRSNSETLTDKTNQRPGLKRGISGLLYDIFDEADTHPSYVPEEPQSPLNTSTLPFHLAPGAKTSFAKGEPSQGTEYDLAPPPVPPVPFQFSDISASQVPDREQAVSPTSGFRASTSTRASPLPWGSRSSSGTFSPVPEAGNGLLSQKLREQELNGNSSEHNLERG